MKKGYKECPFCKEEIKEGAIKCPFCREFLNLNSVKEEIIQKDEILKKNEGINLNEAIKKQEEVRIKREEEKEKIKKIKVENQPKINNKLAKYFSKFFVKLWELIKIILSIGERRISVIKGAFLYFLSIPVIYRIVSLFLLIFGIKPSLEYENPAMYITAGLWIIFLHAYIMPKRAHDWGEPGWHGLIPFHSIHLLWDGGQKGENEYGPEPSFFNALADWLPKERGNKLKQNLDYEKIVIVKSVDKKK